MNQDATSPAETRPHKPRRSHARLRVGVAARFETLEGTFNVRLADISQSGAHIILPAKVSVREGLLQCFDMELFGIAVWYRGNELGVEFDEQLSYDDLLAIRQIAPAVVREEAMEAALAAREFVAGQRRSGIER